jgi:hypothetical protein
LAGLGHGNLNLFEARLARQIEDATRNLRIGRRILAAHA